MGNETGILLDNKNKLLQASWAFVFIGHDGLMDIKYILLVQL